MAYTRAQVRDLVRRRCDIENSSQELDSEINQHLNDAAAYVHDFLIGTLGELYETREATLTVAAGATSVTSSFTGVAADIYRPISLRIVFDDISYPLAAFSRADHVQLTQNTSWGPGYLPCYRIIYGAYGSIKFEFSPPPDTTQSVIVTYHGIAPVYTADSDLVWLPYPDLLVVEAAIRMKDKEERDSQRLMAERALIQKRIEDWVGTVDSANPPHTMWAPKGARAIWRRQRLF